MSESLFRRLCEAHPTSLQRLSYQYRMNGDVMTLCNDLTYSGRLRCGNAGVENQRLAIPNLAAIPPPTALAGSNSNSSGRVTLKSPAWQGKMPPSKPGTPSAAPRGSGNGTPEPWLSSVLCPDRRVVFLDTDALSLEAGGGAQLAGGGSASAWQAPGSSRSFVGLEVRSSPAEHGGQGRGALVNAVECDVVRLLAWGLDVAGFDLGEVGIISPYRSQVHGTEVWVFGRRLWVGRRKWALAPVFFSVA